MDEGTGTTTEDRSGKGNAGTLTNSPTWVKGVRGNALSFVSASTQYVALPSDSLLGLSSATSEKTLSAWIKTSASTASIFGGRGSGGNPVFDFQVGNDGADAVTAGALSFLVRDDAGVGLAHIHSTTLVNNNAWHHVAAVVSSSKNMYIYIDGVQAASGTHTMTSAVTLTSANSRLGSEALNGVIVAMNGQMDDVRIYNRALTAQDVYMLYLSDNRIRNAVMKSMQFK